MNSDLRVHGPFRTKSAPESPVVEEAEPGLRIALSDVVRDGDRLMLTLLFTYGFPDAYFRAFKDIRRAIVVEVQDVDSGASAVFPLLDPTKNDLEPMIENFVAPREGPSVSFVCGWAGVPIDLRAGTGDTLIRASLHVHLSNLLRVAAAEEAP
jgi:hypothetical protein